MRKFLKWTSIALGSIVALGVAAFIALNVMSMLHQRRSYAIAPEKLVLTVPGDRARGEHYVQIGCTGCHGADLGGQVMIDNFMMGQISSKNLTKGEGGVGKVFTRADFVRAIRYGVHTDGHTVLFMPTNALEHLNDLDLASVLDYLETVPPIDRVTPPTRIGPLARVLTVLTPFPLFSAEQTEANATRPTPSLSDTLAYGAYLAEVGGCHECHGTTLANGQVGPNITTGGRLAGWSETDFFRAIREGKRPNGTGISEEMPWKDFSKFTDPELNSLWRYIQSVPPVVPKPK